MSLKKINAEDRLELANYLKALLRSNLQMSGRTKKIVKVLQRKLEAPGARIKKDQLNYLANLCSSSAQLGENQLKELGQLSCWDKVRFFRVYSTKKRSLERSVNFHLRLANQLREELDGRSSK